MSAERKKRAAILRSRGTAPPSSTPPIRPCSCSALWKKQYMDAQAALATSNATKAVLVFPTKDSIPLTHSALQGLMR